MSFTLYLGNKAFSSWSLRGWLAVKATGVDFSEIMIPLRLETTVALLTQYSHQALGYKTPEAIYHPHSQLAKEVIVR